MLGTVLSSILATLIVKPCMTNGTRLQSMERPYSKLSRNGGTAHRSQHLTTPMLLAPTMQNQCRMSAIPHVVRLLSPVSWSEAICIETQIQYRHRKFAGICEKCKSGRAPSHLEAQ
mmetsp:Transcript_81905/g.155514  ORF Transcript_81905/g.155514 Transcript_81905/m.155514 type:complete len:116 (-) Transcript_81905:34-381(-)